MSVRYHSGFLLGDVARLDAALPPCLRKRRFATFVQAHAWRETLYQRLRQHATLQRLLVRRLRVLASRQAAASYAVITRWPLGRAAPPSPTPGRSVKRSMSLSEPPEVNHEKSCGEQPDGSGFR